MADAEIKPHQMAANAPGVLARVRNVPMRISPMAPSTSATRAALEPSLRQAGCVTDQSSGERSSPADLKAKAIEFIDTAINHRDPRRAADRFIGPFFWQHEPGVEDGVEAFIAAVDTLLAAHPEMKIQVRRAAADNDLVFLHILAVSSPTRPGSGVVDIFRFEDGKIVEHWEVIQTIPPGLRTERPFV